MQLPADYLSTSPEQTEALAAEFAGSVLRGGGVLALYGDLGSGKTCFVRGLARAVNADLPVSSPTYTLVHEYGGAPPLVHMDLYRLQNADEIYELGWEEYLEQEDLVAVEWAERATSLLPPDSWEIRFAAVPDRPDARQIRISQPEGAS